MPFLRRRLTGVELLSSVFQRLPLRVRGRPRPRPGSEFQKLLWHINRRGNEAPANSSRSATLVLQLQSVPSVRRRICPLHLTACCVHAGGVTRRSRNPHTDPSCGVTARIASLQSSMREPAWGKLTDAPLGLGFEPLIAPCPTLRPGCVIQRGWHRQTRASEVASDI